MQFSLIQFEFPLNRCLLKLPLSTYILHITRRFKTQNKLQKIIFGNGCGRKTRMANMKTNFFCQEGEQKNLLDIIPFAILSFGSSQTQSFAFYLCKESKENKEKNIYQQISNILSHQRIKSQD
jgi:hypothetical protein